MDNPPSKPKSPDHGSGSPERIPRKHAKHADSQRLPAWFGLALGIGLFVIMQLAPAPEGMQEAAWNVATTATFLPVIAALAVAMGVEEMMLLVPAAMGASMAFMMPVATPPNAIVFGGGHLTIPDMAKAGFWINISAIVVITTLVWFLVPMLFIG